jgi:ATP-dependent DNA ligase
MAWRDGNDVRLYTRRGFDWSDRYLAVVTAVRALKVCLIDGELVVDGRSASFDGCAARLMTAWRSCALDLLASMARTCDGSRWRRAKRR